MPECDNYSAEILPYFKKKVFMVTGYLNFKKCK